MNVRTCIYLSIILLIINKNATKVDHLNFNSRRYIQLKTNKNTNNKFKPNISIVWL